MRLSPIGLIGLTLAFAACGYKENGDSCWSDDQCISSNCSWGSCEPNLLDWIAGWGERDPPSAPLPSSAPAPDTPPPPPTCVGMEEYDCRAAARCRWTAICFDGPGSAEFPDAGVFACMQEYRATLHCPAGCTLWASCI
ncbi:MAG TPA: hypothetical protein VMG12_29860 [Polyangiaceae bacterium]|nr:hypothetical protein [Polyangiaceae bacterium]